MVASSAVGPIRPWTDADDVTALTRLLHVAYRPLLDGGMQYLAARQDDATTLRRIGGGRLCWIIEEPELLATVTLSPPRLVGGCEWYDRPDVTAVGQLAVHPRWQRNGIGRLLIEHAERAAAGIGAAELAVDTSEHAAHLIEWYERQGYRRVGEADWQMTNYRSVVLSKSLTRPSA